MQRVNQKQQDKKNRVELVATLEIINNIVWNGSNSFQHRTLDHETRFWALRLPLCANHLTLCLGLCLELIILYLPQFEFLSAP